MGLFGIRKQKVEKDRPLTLEVILSTLHEVQDAVTDLSARVYDIESAVDNFDIDDSHEFRSLAQEVDNIRCTVDDMDQHLRELDQSYNLIAETIQDVLKTPTGEKKPVSDFGQDDSPNRGIARGEGQAEWRGLK